MDTGPQMTPKDGLAASVRTTTTAEVLRRRSVTLTVRDLAALLCSVQGNDHYDTDYAPCSGCREIAEDIARDD